MMYTKPFDVAGLAATAVAVLYSAMFSTEGALMLGGFTLFVYTCVLFAPGMGGRIGAAIIIPLMGLFTISFAALTENIWCIVVVAAASVRAGMLLVGSIRMPPPQPVKTE